MVYRYHKTPLLQANGERGFVFYGSVEDVSIRHAFQSGDKSTKSIMSPRAYVKQAKVSCCISSNII